MLQFMDTCVGSSGLAAYSGNDETAGDKSSLRGDHADSVPVPDPVWTGKSTPVARL
jgi:hypothetical protein